MKYIGQHIFDYVASFRQNVGIGTDTPNAALHVYGTTGIISESPGNATITIRRNDNVQYGATLKYHSGNTEKWVAGLSDAGDFTNSTGNEYFIGTAKTSPVFLINSSGQVGIGLTNPQNPLSVQSASNTVARFTSTDNRGNILIEDDDTSGYVVAEGGTLGFGFSASQSANNINVDSSNNNVGIGTVSPDNILHITKDQGGAASALKLENKAGANNTGFDIDFQLASSGLSAKIGAVRTNSPGAGDSDIFFSTSTNGTSVTEAMRITHDGNVLIGTATDNNSRLRILGATSDATKSALEIRDSSASALFTVRNDGRIDTSGNLNVGGDLTVTGTTTTIDTTNLNVEDKNITINYSTGDSSSTADGAGITIQDAVDSSTDATLLWNTSNSTFNFSHGIRVPDNVKIQAGNGGDFDIFHTGSATTIDNATGHLTIQNSADDSDIVFKSDDGSGGLATYITIDGSTNRVNFNKPIKIADNTAVNIGSGLDLRLSHDGTDSTIRNYAGDLKIIASDDDKDIIFQSDDGSGGVETYFFLDGSESVVTFPDDKRLTFGTGRDLFLYHTGTDMVMKNFTGDMTIRNEANDKDIIFQSDDGSGGVTDYIRIDGSADNTKIYKDLRYQDNVKAKFGAVGDLEIYHDGSNSYITDSGTGDLLVSSFTLQGTGRIQGVDTVSASTDAANKFYVDSKKESFVLACSDETTDLTASSSVAKVTFRMPYAFNLSAVRASVSTAPAGSTITVDVKKSGTSIFSTALTIDAGEKTSTTASTAAVIANDSLSDDEEITVFCTQIGSSTAGKGLKVTLIGNQ